MDFVEIAGWLGAILTFAAYAMRSMWLLRVVAVGANIAFIIFSIFTPIYPTLFLHLALLPLNLFRLIEMYGASRRLREARKNENPLDHLMPFLRPVTVADGTYLFRRGDPPDQVYYLRQGRIELPELGATLEPGALFGEMAYFSGDKARTTSAICRGACQVMVLDEDTFMRLFHQKPDFAFYVIRLIAQRLIAGAGTHPDLYRAFAQEPQEGRRDPTP